MLGLAPLRPAAASPACGARRASRMLVVIECAKGKSGSDKGKPKKGAAKEEAAKPCRPAPYLSADTIMHSLTLLDSFKRTTGRTLLPPGLAISEAPRALFEAPIVLVSHGTEADPVFNYANAAALALWEMDWETFTRTPSRQSAQADDTIQSERTRLLAEAASKGFSDGYSGVRVSSSGRRFRIQDATVWTITTPKGFEGAPGQALGQAAVFSGFEWLDDGPDEAAGRAGDRWRVAQGGALEAVPPPPEPASAQSLERARAAVEAQGAVVRALKAGGKGNEDPEVAAAVAALLETKTRVAGIEAELAAAGSR